MTRSKVYECHRRFKKGQESFGDDERFGRPSTSRYAENVALVSECVRKVRLQTLAEIAEAAHLSKTSCQRILTEDLNMHRVSEHIVTRLLITGLKGGTNDNIG